MTDASDSDFEEFLNYLAQSRHFDFTAYKRGSLSRRVLKRMGQVGITSYGDYTDYLEVHPEEFTELFNTILINVTSFFRDLPAWEFLAQNVLPEVLQNKRPSDTVRVWTAGCASGQEAFTIAMVLAELMGDEAFRQHVKIYATDIDEEALSTARQAIYTSKDLSQIPPRYRQYFEPSNGRFAFRKDLRRAVIFGRHNLLEDAPISRIDLLICRNTLMYLNSEGQGRVLSRLFFALNSGGYLLLGKAETLFQHTSSLAPVDLKLRIFAKAARRTLRERFSTAGELEPEDSPSGRGIRELTFELDPIAQMIVDADGAVMGINERARTLFGIAPSDIGRPLQDLEISYRPVELRSVIEKVEREGHGVTLPDLEWNAGGARRWLEINVVRLPDGDGTSLGVKVIFTDVTRFKDLQQQLERSNRELETAYEELQSSNEELETTNEELQSTVEELETTNEELQSTNEELETMNEELQSANEELETVNTEIQGRTREVTDLNAFLESILGSLSSALVVVDRELRVTAWNERAEDFWGLRHEEVRGKHFLNLDIGLPVDALRAPVRDCLAGNGDMVATLVQATNRRGRSFSCRVTCTAQRDNDGVSGVILVMDNAELTAAK